MAWSMVRNLLAIASVASIYLALAHGASGRRRARSAGARAVTRLTTRRSAVLLELVAITVCDIITELSSNSGNGV